MYFLSRKTILPVNLELQGVLKFGTMFAKRERELAREM